MSISAVVIVLERRTRGKRYAGLLECPEGADLRTGGLRGVLPEEGRLWDWPKWCFSGLNTAL